MRRLNLILWAVVFLLSTESFAEVQSGKPLALVYNGPGACTKCWSSAAQVAHRAGFAVKLVGAHFKDSQILKQAKLWLQPGGKSEKAADAMGADYLKEIRDFVRNGGGYVGFCAGAFFATQKIGTSEMDGLGILPGKTILWDEQDGGAQITPVNWNGKMRYIYYHGGPYFDLTGVTDPNVVPFATYDDGKVNAIRAPFGRGRVAATGAHPEASATWKFLKGKKDPDGSDRDLVIEMIQWVTAGQSSN